MRVSEVRRLAAYIAVSTGFGYAEILNMDLDEVVEWANAVTGVHTATER